jgi:hypothetical protein
MSWLQTCQLIFCEFDKLFKKSYMTRSREYFQVTNTLSTVSLTTVSLTTISLTKISLTTISLTTISLTKISL